jgi:hypothetical protein
MSTEADRALLSGSLEKTSFFPIYYCIGGEWGVVFSLSAHVGHTGPLGFQIYIYFFPLACHKGKREKKLVVFSHEY